MAEKPRDPKAEKAERLAAQLRANLKRRKDAQRQAAPKPPASKD